MHTILEYLLQNDGRYGRFCVAVGVWLGVVGVWMGVVVWVLVGHRIGMVCGAVALWVQHRVNVLIDIACETVYSLEFFTKAMLHGQNLELQNQQESESAFQSSKQKYLKGLEFHF